MGQAAKLRTLEECCVIQTAHSAASHYADHPWGDSSCSVSNHYSQKKDHGLEYKDESISRITVLTILKT